jgi:hypothetical protein
MWFRNAFDRELISFDAALSSLLKKWSALVDDFRTFELPVLDVLGNDSSIAMLLVCTPQNESGAYC